MLTPMTEPAVAEATTVEPPAAVSLEVVFLPLDKLDPNPWNPNQQSAAVAQAERESIKLYGFVDPVTVRVHPEEAGRWQIIDGEHRCREALGLGYVEVPCVVLDLDDVAARKLTVILNETKGEADVVLLGTLLAELQRMDAESYSVGMPYGDRELEHLLQMAAVDWDQYGPGADDVEPVPETPSYDVILAYGEADYAEYQELVAKLRETMSVDGEAGTVLEALRQAAA